MHFHQVVYKDKEGKLKLWSPSGPHADWWNKTIEFCKTQKEFIMICSSQAESMHYYYPGDSIFKE